MRAKKSLGQNFLIDERTAERIVEAAGPLHDRVVVEIGPGHGALTSKLVSRAERVIAVEFDSELAVGLREKFEGINSTKIIEADALNIDFCSLIEPGSRAVVVANLPYYISTAILQKLVQDRQCLDQLILMLQREVVARLSAPAGNSERGFLSVLVQAFCKVEPLFDVPPGAFRPIPKVWSSVARLRFHDSAIITDSERGRFEALISAGFSQKRKTILNNLRHAPPPLRRMIEDRGGSEAVLKAAGIESRVRAEQIDLQGWKRLLDAVSG
jgi:16S rRNA (adenine1518-N6/adenine1519-N6)-dimethyltransferase